MDPTDVDVTVLAADVQGGNVFVPPTTETVKQSMPQTQSSKRQKVIDPELIRRRAAASAKMTALGIGPDNKSSAKKRCNVCGKYYEFALGDIPHLRKRKFCPLADNHSIYHTHKEGVKQRGKEKRKRHKQRQRAQKQADSGTN